MEIWKENKQTLLSQWECILENTLSRLLKHLKQQGETIILTWKSATNLKSTECRELKTEDTFCVIFIWLISSYHLNLILWCHWRVVLFLFCLCLLFIWFSSSVFSFSVFLLVSHYLPILLSTLTASLSSEETNLSPQCYQKTLLLLKPNTTYQFIC